MANPETSVADQIAHLEAARKLVLGDSVFYTQIIQGILPVIDSKARIEFRRWGAEFLAETFASPMLAVQQKESLGLMVLETLKDMLEVPSEDSILLKNAIQACASIYPLIFRHILSDANDTATWKNVAAIKSRVLKLWDTASGGIRMCCIKFVQKVIQVQTPGLIADPRRPEQNEISLALVPRNHPLIPPSSLEAETAALLDRLLSVFEENSYDAILVNATINCLSTLIRTRPSISNKIISAILNFNPLKQANTPMTPKIRVMVRSMERTTRSLLANLNKQNPNGPLAPRIQQHLERLNRIRLDVFDEGTRKRAAPVEPTDGLDPTKRARLGADVPNIPSSRIRIPPLAPGPTSLAQLYTLTSDQALTSFDVQQLPIDMVIQITLPVLFRLEQSVLDDCINGVRARYRSLGALQQVNAPSIPTAAPPMEDEDDDYEPDFEPAEDDEQILNKLDTAPPGSEVVPALGPFRLPPPPRLTETEATDIGQGVISRVFGFMNALDEPPRSKQPKTGINRLAASTYDKHAWVTVVTRLATRASSGLGSSANVKSEDADSALDGGHPSTTLSESIREALYMHIIADFRPRIDIAVAWLTEEWYNDRIIASASEASSQGTLQYDRSVLRVLDGILPYLDARDKVFTRFLSEIPVISPAVLERVKRLARDPERVMLAVSSLHYLVLLRPPAREMSLDALEDLWQNYDDARLAAAKVLSKWRPLAVQPEPIAKPPTVISPQDGSGVTPKEEMQVAREGVTASS